MDAPSDSTTGAAATATASGAGAAQLADVVRDALAAVYARPVVAVEGELVAVPSGRALELARAAVASWGGAAAADRVVAIDLVARPHRPVAGPGVLRVWRQHGRSGSDGELVTELEVGDPPLQVVVDDEGWRLVCLADGAQGWLEPGATLGPELTADVPSIGPRTELVDVEAFVVAAEALLDVPYVWGGTTDAGVDCSGIVQRAAWRASAGACWLPRHSRALLRVGSRVSPSEVRRGDVLVLQRDPSTVDAERAAQAAARAAQERRTGRVPAHGPAVHPMHVAIVTGANEALHASRDAMRVVREPLDAMRARYRVLGVRRLGGDVSPAPSRDDSSTS